MNILLLKTMFFAVLFGASALASVLPPKLLIDSSDEELLRRAPELAGTRFDRDAALVRTVLLPALESVNQSFDKFADLSAAEKVSELRLDDGGAAARSQTEHFRYVATRAQNSLEFRELRRSEKGDKKDEKAGAGGYVVGERFYSLMETLLPEFVGQLRIRPVGRLGDNVIFAFVQTLGGEADSRPMQGLVWIDAKRAQPVRLRCVLATNAGAATPDERSVDLTFAEVHFEALDATLLLPVRVVVGARHGDVRTQAVHSFSDFHLYGRDDASDPALAKKNAGVFAAVAAEPDALEKLSEGVVALDGNSAAGAIAPLREALRLDPALAAAHYHLARALRATGDASAAEIEARAALVEMSLISAAHNLLGVVLLERGATADAMTELRETVRLAPGEAMAHGNLARALDAKGDRPGALAALRHAIELDPANQALKLQLDRMSSTPPEKAAGGNETTIRVDVRQVLIPVVVLDKSGHTVSGLK